MLALSLALLIAIAIPASALTIWYGGDPDGGNGWASEQGGFYNNALTFDDFSTTGNGWSVYYLLGNFATNAKVTNAYYEIRSGVSEGNGGTLVSSGNIDVTQTWTGDSIGTWGGDMKVYTLAGNTAAINLNPGTYWLGFAPVVGQNANLYSWAMTTSGDGGMGTPVSNGNSFVKWGDNANFQGVGQDISYGVFANPVVPEPGSMLAFGMGLVAFVPFLRKKA